MSLYNRVKGAAKAGIGAAYWSIAISSGGSLPAITALYGIAIIATGRIIRSVGQITDYEPLKKTGADIGNIGVKIALSPIYFSTLGLDGLANLYNGKADNNFSNSINRNTNWISGTKNKIANEAVAPTAHAPNNTRAAELDARAAALDARAAALDAKTASSLNPNTVAPSPTKAALKPTATPAQQRQNFSSKSGATATRSYH